MPLDLLNACIADSSSGNIKMTEIRQLLQMVQVGIIDLRPAEVEVFESRQTAKMFQPVASDLRFIEDL